MNKFCIPTGTYYKTIRNRNRDGSLNFQEVQIWRYLWSQTYRSKYNPHQGPQECARRAAQ